MLEAGFLWKLAPRWVLIRSYTGKYKYHLVTKNRSQSIQENGPKVGGGPVGGPVGALSPSKGVLFPQDYSIRSLP